MNADDAGCAPQDVGTAPQRRTLTIPESAIALGVSVALLRDLIRGGSVPVLRLGRRVLVRQATIERLLAEPEGSQEEHPEGRAAIVELLAARGGRERGGGKSRTT